MSEEETLRKFAENPSIDDVGIREVGKAGREYEEHAAAALDILKGHESDVATRQIGLIGREYEEHAAAALEILEGRKTDESTKQVGLIGREYEEHAAAALDILKDRETDESTKQIGEIGRAHKGEYGAAALEILKDRKGDEVTRQIGEIGRAHKGEYGAAALEILKDRKTDVATGEIGQTGYQYEEHAAAALDILKDRDGDETARQIVMIGYTHKGKYAGAALKIIKGGEGDKASMWGGAIGRDYEEHAAAALDMLEDREGDEATKQIGKIGGAHKGEYGEKAQSILLNRAEKGMGSGQAVSDALEKLIPAQQALERILTCGDRLADDKCDLQSEDYKVLRDVAWALSKKISEPAFLVEKLKSHKSDAKDKKLKNFIERVEGSPLLLSEGFAKTKLLSKIFGRAYDDVHKPSPIQEAEGWHAAAFSSNVPGE